MPLERLEPEVKRYDLRPVRLWQDELTEIVRLVRQLPDVDVRIESDGYSLTDVKDDLPKLGPKLKYFTIVAVPRGQVMDSEAVPKPVIKIALSGISSSIEATDPDLTTMGLIQAIQALMDSCRRLPRWLPKSFLPIFIAGPQSIATSAASQIVATPLGGPTVYSGSPQASADGVLGLLLTIAAIAASIVCGIGAVQHLTHSHGKPVVVWPASIIVAISCLLLSGILIIAMSRMRSLLFAATREEAPTFWQAKRSDIAINVIVGLIFFLLGLLVAHL